MKFFENRIICNGLGIQYLVISPFQMLHSLLQYVVKIQDVWTLSVFFIYPPVLRNRSELSIWSVSDHKNSALRTIFDVIPSVAIQVSVQRGREVECDQLQYRKAGGNKSRYRPSGTWARIMVPICEVSATDVLDWMHTVSLQITVFSRELDLFQ